MVTSDSNVGCEDGLCRPLGSRETAESSSMQQDNPSKDDHDQGSNRIKIDIISDTMCPWCWVGKRNLEKALEDMPEIQAEINWLPYFLDKNLPEAGKPVAEYYVGNYGDARAGERMKPGLVAAGKRCGIDFETYYINMTHYRPTIRSHRLIQLAKRCNKQDAMVEELFKIYYEEGKHLNSIEHLEEAAKRVDLDDINVQEYLAGNEDEKEVYEEAAKIKHMVQGVPTFIFTKPGTELYHTFSGGQPPSAFKEVFNMFFR
jgi:predicted DsbA family dithiol-disulfide isomerase